MNRQASLMVRCENVAKMALANDDDVIKTFPSDRADQPLRISVLPRRPRRDRSVTNAHGSDAPDEGSAIGAVTVADQVARGWAVTPLSVLGSVTRKAIARRRYCRSTYERLHRSSYPGGIDRLGGRAILINHLCRIRCCREKRDSP
jgi:hypothetical protein